MSIGNRVIGLGQRCFVIAEAGVNHNGDVTLAHQLVDAAADAGADAVKFQTFDPARLVAAETDPAPYQVRNTGASSQRRMLDALVLPEAAWGDLSGHARERGLVFLSTPFDLSSLDLLERLGVPAFKVPSGELTNLPFIRSLAERDRPLLMSTGMATVEEIDAALDAAQKAPGMCLFHCVTAYPTPVREANIRAVATMIDRFGVPVGWSDHTVGSLTAVATIALGASLLEKHLTIDRSLPGPDHVASSDPEGFGGYVATVRDAEAAMGSGEKRATAAEQENRVLARRSWHASNALPAGHALAEGDVVALRPAVGVTPDREVVGRRMARAIAAGAPIAEDDLVPVGRG